MKQTSIEWLIDQMFKQGYFDGNKPLTYTNLDHLQQQAKQMHKDEIYDAYELPTDEEIEEEAKDKINLSADCFGQYDFTSGKQDGFIDGAIWMRDKIKGGNK